MPDRRPSLGTGTTFPGNRSDPHYPWTATTLPSLRLARSSRLVRKIAWMLVMLMAGAIVLLVFAPWQQSVKGTGSVIAFAPLDRMQVIEAPVKGRIVKWGDDIFENARVQKDQLIVEIRDIDENYSLRIEQQLTNSQQQVTAAKQQHEASQRGLEAAQTIIEALENQVRAYTVVKDETVAAQDAYIVMSKEKVKAEQQQLEEYVAAIAQLQAEYDRSLQLQQAGNLALQKLQEVERKLNEAQAKVSRGKAYVASAKADLEGKVREREAKSQKAQVDIDYAQATLRKAKGDVIKAEGDIAKAQQELNKAEKDLLESQVKVSRQDSQIVRAPFDGFITQITPSLSSGLIKEGDPLCTIVPDTADRAVQVWLDGNDAPLVEVGRHVRLQFEGWPAIQFAGWPSVAVGTFGGDVVSVDATDNGKGKFRVLIRPAQDDAAWPEQRFLRQGVRANGWVLLDQVPLWFEVWRQLNGFPPVVHLDEPEDSKGSTKAPKLPK